MRLGTYKIVTVDDEKWVQNNQEFLFPAKPDHPFQCRNIFIGVSKEEIGNEPVLEREVDAFEHVVEGAPAANGVVKPGSVGIEAEVQQIHESGELFCPLGEK